MDETTRLIITFLSGPIFLGATAAVWYYFTRVREPARIKEQQAISTATRERIRSLQVFDEQSEKSALAQVLESFSDLVKHSIESNNGHMSKLTEAVLEGNKEMTRRFAELAAAQNQIVAYLVGQSGRLPTDANLEAAQIKTPSVQRVEQIAAAVEASIHPSELTKAVSDEL